MIHNPYKFHSIILTKNKAENLDLEIKTGDKTIQSEQYLKLLGVTIDSKLNFKKYVSDLCRTESAQLNVLFSFSNILPFKAKFVLVQSFVYSNFNYCPLVWHFLSSKYIMKVEKNQKRALRFLHNDAETSDENLLSKTNKNFMSIYRLRSLCIVFKTINDLNSSFMKDIFQLRINERPVRTQNTNNLTVEIRQTITFGTNIISYLGPKIWNSLP